MRTVLIALILLANNAQAGDTPKIVIIDSATPTEALLAKPGTYLGEKFTYATRHTGETIVLVGVWEAGPGKIPIQDFPFTEYVLMISGSVVVTNEDGSSHQFDAGDTFVLPKGWSGDWDVKERMKKQIVRIGDANLLGQ